MGLDILLRLEEKIDQLLAQKQQLEIECHRLREDKITLTEERDFVAHELDRILTRLDLSLERESS
jgi:cell division protein ZapB